MLTSDNKAFAQGCTEVRFWGKSGAPHLFIGSQAPSRRRALRVRFRNVANAETLYARMNGIGTKFGSKILNYKIRGI